jgi:hypothetical protein
VHVYVVPAVGAAVRADVEVRDAGGWVEQDPVAAALEDGGGYAGAGEGAVGDGDGVAVGAAFYGAEGEDVGFGEVDG